MRKVINVCLILLCVLMINPPIKIYGKAEAVGCNLICNSEYKNAKCSNESEKITKKVANIDKICSKIANNNADKKKDVETDYYIIYDAEDAKKVIFVRGDGVLEGDEYISSSNKKYVICELNEKEKTAKAKFVEDVKLPVLNVKRNEKRFASNETENVKTANAESFVKAQSSKKIGLYHTHNDECYNDEDGTDSVYGKGGIHDIGKKFKSNLEKLGIDVKYSEDLHLPHNSGAYTRSEATVSKLLNDGDLDAIFDVHRDATPRKEYITKVNGEVMSKVRMVVGAGNATSAQNKDFALTIKAYADEVYPGLIKDIYIGKGNYNQQHFEKAMLFEMGTNTIEKEYVRRSTLPLAKTIDAVLFGVDEASEITQGDVEKVSSNGKTDTQNVASVSGGRTQNSALWIVLGSVGGLLIVLSILYAVLPKFRFWVKRTLSQMFPFKKP